MAKGRPTRLRLTAASHPTQYTAFGLLFSPTAATTSSWCLRPRGHNNDRGLPTRARAWSGTRSRWSPRSLQNGIRYSQRTAEGKPTHRWSRRHASVTRGRRNGGGLSMAMVTVTTPWTFKVRWQSRGSRRLLGYRPHMHRDRPIWLDHGLPYLGKDDFAIWSYQIIMALRYMLTKKIHMHECLSYQLLHTLESSQ